MSNDAPKCAPPNSATVDPTVDPTADPTADPRETGPELDQEDVGAGLSKRGPTATQSGGGPSAWLTPATPPPLPESLGTTLGSVAKQPASAVSSPSASSPSFAGQALIGPYSSRLKRTGQRRPATEDRQPTPEALRVRVWKDELLGHKGYPATGFYVERYWGPIVGPTTLMLYRTVARRLEAEPDGFSVLTNKLAGTVGCSARTGSASQFWRAIRRANRFGLLRQQDDRIVVRPAVGLLTSRMAQRLPQELRHEHRIWTVGGPENGSDLNSPQSTLINPNRAVPAPGKPHEQDAQILALELLRTAARGLCTPEELRILDNQRRLV